MNEGVEEREARPPDVREPIVIIESMKENSMAFGFSGYGNAYGRKLLVTCL